MYFQKLDRALPNCDLRVGEKIAEYPGYRLFDLQIENQCDLTELIDLLNPRQVRLCEISPNIALPPHGEPNVRTMMCFYLSTRYALTEFWDPLPDAHSGLSDNFGDNLCFQLEDVELNSGFMPETGDVYLLDTRHAHSVRTTQIPQPQHVIQFTWMDSCFEDIRQMLN